MKPCTQHKCCRDETDVKEFEKTLPDGTVVDSDEDLDEEPVVMTQREHTQAAPTHFPEEVCEENVQPELQHHAEGDEKQGMAGQEADDDKAVGDDLQTTRLMMKKPVHQKTTIRDGKAKVIVTGDTHIEQDNTGPEELQEYCW